MKAGRESAKPTLQVIADQAGTSRMTVSRALRDDPAVSAVTRRRIHTIARRLGYQPDPVISQLMVHLRRNRSERTTTLPLAFVTAHHRRHAWKDSGVIREVHRGAQARAKELGYHLEEFWAAEPGMSEARLSDILFHRGVRGVLVAPFPESGGRLRLQWDRFAAATVGFSLVEPSLYRVASHQFHAMHVALEELARLGYERIGLAVPAVADERVDHLWQARFLLYQQGLATKHRVPALLDPQLDAAQLVKWFKRHKPDALISSEPLMQVLREAGWHAPQDYGFASINVDESPASLALAGVDHRSAELGATAIDQIVGQIQTFQRGVPAVPRVVLLQCAWRRGRSVRDPALAGVLQ